MNLFLQKRGQFSVLGLKTSSRCNYPIHFEEDFDKLLVVASQEVI